MKRSSDILNGAEWANVRALYKSSGFTDDELKNPIIAVVNAYNQVCPGHVVLKQLTQRSKRRNICCRRYTSGDWYNRCL